MMEPFENSVRRGTKWNWWQLDLVLIVILLCSCFPQIGSLSLKPPAEEILNTQLCPNPVIARGFSTPDAGDSTKIMAIGLDQVAKPKDKSYSYFARFTPCTFTEDSDNTLLGAIFGGESNPNATQIRIKSINLSTEPWKFSGSAKCTKFIMFKSRADYGNGYSSVMCGRDNFDEYLGPYGYPMILYYHLKERGIAFPLLHPNYGPNNRDLKETFELKYMLIYYSIKKNGLHTCQLQQYAINPRQQYCSPTDINCGEYDCTELDTLYQKKMGMVRNGDHHQQRFIIVKSKNQEKYRVRNFLRQKFVPIVFLLVLIFAYKSYMKAGLRLNDPLPLQVSEMRLRRYQQRQSHNLHHHHAHNPPPYMSSSGGDQFRDIYFEYGNEHIPGLHIPFEPNPPGITPVDPLQDPDAAQQCPPNNRAKFGHGIGGPPPSYESLFPPTYNEATSSADPKNPKV
ncbi:hypothetical protein Ocin01_04114 [Orchesella cincta]|uniref:Uncharacterized protein n=1 Tax=Orchesella cincta TaxID=48709 RepID=A0A1D2NBD1_ORCCI|nr:hypothetical protein Ocin01_04114 [Orchesella cincta]